MADDIFDNAANYVHVVGTPPSPPGILTVANPGGTVTYVQGNSPYLGVKKLYANAKLPVKAHLGDLAYDLFAVEDTTLAPGQVTKVKTGIACKFPYGYGAVIKDRSSVATKENEEVFTVAGVLDSAYTGEIIVAFYNPMKFIEDDETGFLRYFYSDRKYFQAGEKVAQMILTPVITFPVQEITGDIEHDGRGDNGFGSTNLK